MITEAIGTVEPGRFRNLLAGTGSECDQVLLEVHECVVAPTLGSIISKWLLVVPRRPTISFRDWSAHSDVSPSRLVRDVLAKLNVAPGQAIWFEHGTAVGGDSIGCGVDYAHLHILVDPPFTFEDVAAASIKGARLSWQEVSELDAYAALSSSSSYLIVGSPSSALFAERVERAGSQFFRKVIAGLVGRTEQWNYKTHAHIENIRRTVATFSPKSLV